MHISVAGHKAFFSTGSGQHVAENESVLFVHGAGFDHTVWTLPARYFARRGLNVIAVDLPGRGLSGGAALTSIEAMADWLCLLLDELDIRQASVVGHSMGSLVALNCAAKYPDRVRNLALLGTSTPMPVSDPLLDAARANQHQAIDMANTWSHSSFAHQGGNENPGLTLTLSGQRLLERAGPGVYFADLNACNDFIDGEMLAAQVKVETLVVLGLEDRMTKASAGRSVAAAIRNAKVVELDACGHSMLTEQPNAVLDALAALV